MDSPLQLKGQFPGSFELDSRTSRNLYLGYPDFNYYDNYAHRFGYTLNHRFNENWQIRNNLSVSVVGYESIGAGAGSIEDDRFADVDSYTGDYRTTNYFGQIDLLGKFNTGSISHQLLSITQARSLAHKIAIAWLIIDVLV